MKSVITLEVTHTKPIEGLADAIAARAYTLDRVEDVVVITDAQAADAARYRVIRDWGASFMDDNEVGHQVCEWAMDDVIDAFRFQS